jgi:hypothetical protein
VIKCRLCCSTVSTPFSVGGREHAVSEYAAGIFWRSRNCEIMLLFPEDLIDVIRMTEEIYGTREKVQAHDVAVIAGASLEQTYGVVLELDEVTREKVASQTGRKL